MVKAIGFVRRSTDIQDLSLADQKGLLCECAGTMIISKGGG